jgi:GNAT superfamily N-acetyltransferase
MECAGTYAVFSGIGSAVTQSFGLGIFEDLTTASLDVIESFFFDRGAAADHEVSPLAGVAALDLLCARNYRPIEISSVLYRPVETVAAADHSGITVRVVGSAENELWTNTNARGWAQEYPELLESLLQMTELSLAREGTVCFLAELDGRAGAAGALCLHNGVALFAGASTIPELRRRGLQRALLQERMRYAFDQGCNLAMMVAEVGSNSQRNAEREGFRIAYTRTKWRLDRHPD